MENEYIRTELLLGSEGMKRLSDASVTVFGVGGVGSHCIEALARCGVGKFVLIDNDFVSLSNINRQSIAYHSTIGRYKTKVMQERIADICPDIEVITHEEFVLPANLESVFPRQTDYIVDAIDTVTAKLAIVELAQKRNIPLISSMGTGNKLHPELFEIGDIYQTTVCPLCKVMRKELRARGIQELKVLFSREKPLDTANRMQRGTRPVPGSVSFVPPVAGLLIAGEVIRDLAGIE
ncbi:MAG: tRNA threonylcarbamoyladenosine dehydratase [Hespellia sp.]|nr:tRNA threonylcarbamoyladenosine dehydratase [Hespellia sp.]